ncbi:MAG: NAD(P)-dependent glycerol-3-phosphate dehydrogenase [Saprospiraceae bacterium]|nr:NAD(P)-dependent glycerol-3-phosphate dehydrogenase [Saprospiraceae bacterium]
MNQVAVIGAGSFGIAIAKLLSHNVDVLVVSRSPDTLKKINEDHFLFQTALSTRIRATQSLEEGIASSKLIFPIIPSDNFPQMIKEASAFLTPAHILIHGTKGFVLSGIDETELVAKTLRKDQVLTMSDLIRKETSVLRIGCLSGPNLAKEILVDQPTATVIASEFDEVIQVGIQVLSSKKFFVFGSNDLKGAQIAGTLKNIIAIGSGMLDGLGMGKNIQAILITRGLSEIIHFGQKMGASNTAFLGTAGIGDLIATATSPDSRNYQFGKRLGKGENFNQIMGTSDELAEGVRTLKIVYFLLQAYDLRSPIIEILYKVVYENMDIMEGINMLMRYPIKKDVDFMEES